MDRIKYPRTPHFPWSPGATDDDKILQDLSVFDKQPVVITEKMDGENTTIYADGYIHARSLDSVSHYTQSWVRQYAASLYPQMDAGMRICGENVFAKHSIAYDNLESYFYGFSIWIDNECLDWDTTLTYFKVLGITPVPTILSLDFFDAGVIKSIGISKDQEGYVCRKRNSFIYEDFSTSVAKYVRANHVQTSNHWKYDSNIETNKLCQNK